MKLILKTYTMDGTPFPENMNVTIVDWKVVDRTGKIIQQQGNWACVGPISGYSTHDKHGLKFAQTGCSFKSQNWSNLAEIKQAVAAWNAEFVNELEPPAQAQSGDSQIQILQ